MDASAFSLAEVEIATLLLVAFVAFAASIVGGVSGYGVGLILPPVLAPVVGVAGVIPVMAVAMAMTNGSRVLAFRGALDWRPILLVAAGMAPFCFASAYVYTLLPERTVALILGLFLIVSVPLRRRLASAGWQLSARGAVFGGAVYGTLVGTMTGVGPLLLSIMMGLGLRGGALIGSEAAVSMTGSLIKASVFGSADALDLELLVAGLLIGLATVPGAFVAKWLLNRFSPRIHLALMDALVLFGGGSFLWRAWTG